MSDQEFSDLLNEKQRLEWELSQIKKKPRQVKEQNEETPKQTNSSQDDTKQPG